MSTPDPDSRFEAELKRMVPSAPSDRLETVLKQALERRRPRPNQWWRWSATFMPLAAAAGVLLALFLRGPSLDLPQAGSRPETTPVIPTETLPTAELNGDVFIPIKAINQLYDARYLGMVTTPDGEQARQVVYRYLDTVTWQNQASKATFELTVPRDEMHLIAATGL
jgi:hypothetical protein